MMFVTRGARDVVRCRDQRVTTKLFDLGSPGDSDILVLYEILG